MKKKRLSATDLAELQQRVRQKSTPGCVAPSGSADSAIDTKPDKTFLVGIDPDVEKCGFAVKERSIDKIIEVKALHFFDVINRVNQLKQEGAVIAYIDAGWLHAKSNWHQARGLRGEKIAKNVGACHQVGKLLCEYFTRKGIKHYPIKPVSSKIDNKAFMRLGCWQGRTNQDMRDAAFLVWGR